jgi:penicillin-binding protein 2
MSIDRIRLLPDTAQVVGMKKNEKYDAKRMASRLHDHSLYTAFAPADKPRIAIAVIVENGGFGAAVAAPIVRKALDYYLLGKHPDDKANLLAAGSQSAAPKSADDPHLHED